jgi:isoaspartyl peptidase/L-asparaginase-like protein (Ntn-hydrolase superfamily)
MLFLQIQDRYVPADFMVLDMGIEEEKTPIILGRPFLSTTNTVIYIGSGQVHFQFSEGKIRCYFNSYTNHEWPKKNRNRRRRRSRRQANKPLKDGWADYSGEMSRYEDR